MPYKDKEKRYEAIRKSVAKKPELYKALGLNNKRKAHRRGYMIMRRYGLSLKDFNEMVEQQNNCCLFCKKPAGLTKAGRTSLYVDHNHTTGKVRGLLCARCNTLVGYMEQPNIYEILGQIKEYLEKNS